MRSGNATEAELEFKQMTLTYPQLSAPFVNLGILYRKNGRLEQSEQALKSAVERNSASAVAWNELGATQRLRGEFPDAAASYEKAIAADSNFAPAYRNLGVVSDLYLGDPERALTALERYKELTGEDRPVTSWIAELRQRTGKPAVKPPGAAPAATPEAAGANGAAAAGGEAPTGAAGAAPSTAPAPATKPAPKAGG
jgi:tetratricopeptide (TPR) repeat protein